MKRTLSLCLCLTLLLNALALFGGCARQNEINMEGFSIVYPSDKELTTTFRSQTIAFAANVEKATGTRIKTLPDTQSAEKEILVGLTDREESTKAYERIKGNGFAIEIKENTIVIVGNTPIMTLYAMQYFTEQYLGVEKQSTTLSLPRKVTRNKLPTVELANSSGALCSFVYDAALDTKPGNKWTTAYSDYDYDYPYQVLLDCLDALVRQTDLRKNDFTKKADDTEPDGTEVLIGLPNRAEVRECLDTIPDEYAGVFVKNGKVIVTARSDSALTRSREMFIDLIKDATLTAEDGTLSILFPCDLALTDAYFGDYVTDFPKPEGLELYNIQDAGEGALQYLYMGEGVNAQTFGTYCETLVSQGYTPLMENKVEESLFATYTNKKANVSLYVAYNAFLHGADEYDYEPRLRVVSAPLEEYTAPSSDIITADPAYNKTTDSSITAINLPSSDVGMGYVVMLEDGRFVVFDGGSNNEFNEKLNATHLWNTLAGLYQKANGKAPSASDPIKIAAWVITHSHSDHYQVFDQFLTQYAKGNNVKLEYLLGNFPSEMATYNAGGSSPHMTNSARDIASRAPGCKYVRVHTGETYYFANLRIDVLYTQEDGNPLRYDIFNDTSVSLRFTMTATDANGNRVTNEEATVTSVWLADTFIYGSRFMTAMYGDTLQSDMVQLAHHGNVGCESPLYRCIAPKLVWFPHVYTAFKSYTNGTRTDWQSKVDRDLVFDIGSVDYVFVSDVNCITLPLRATGIDYDGIFDAITGEAITYVTYDSNVPGAAVTIP